MAEILREHSDSLGHAGVSRSTAFAYAALCILYASENTTDIFTRLMGITEKPWPNDRIVEEFDRVLNRGGSLTTTLKIYKGMYPLRLEAYRRLNRKRGLVSPVSR
ncbi:hypothetical protein [Rickettsiella endosymbiont of Dermanyssus gallinae]|uniref:hypothetical protein n=1 Tax=Rickettsiella endosymbiont of Dermanyssus gallinae TaxID=2856608 RepID=UPI001C5323F0|nr:hypothetical protein [Rickettsiella endosymbiont of Dermanyssus gallinae]